MRRGILGGQCRKNVEVVRNGWDAAWSKPPNWALLNALYDPDHVFESDYGGVNNTVYRGATGFQRFLADQDETWDDWRHQLDAVVDTGANAVVVEARLIAHGKHTDPFEGFEVHGSALGYCSFG